MEVKFQKKLIISFLLLITPLTFITIYSNSNKKIESIKEENKVSRKQFAMYITNSEGEYVEYTDSEYFPNDTLYVFNTENSYCVDANDNVVDNVISYENNKVKVVSNKTIYCYLYFDTNDFDVTTNMYLASGTNKVKIEETPTNINNYNYVVSYECSNNDGIIGFGYNYYNHTYKLVSATKNNCNIYFEEKSEDIEITLYLNDEYVESLPEDSYNFIPVKYECANNDAITNFGYDYYKDTYVLKSTERNVCKLYFEEMKVDTKLYIYINNELVEEIPDTGTYVINNTKSNCTSSSALISYDDSAKLVSIKTSEKTECNVYLEGA